MKQTIHYSDVQAYLDEAINRAEIGAHGAFWHQLSRDEFIQFQVFGQPLIAVNPQGVFDAEGSALVQCLEGRAPFGVDQGTPGAVFRRMPAGLPPMSTERICLIRDWITDGCPL